MSEKPPIEEAPRRYLKDHDGPPWVACYLNVRKMTIGDLRAHFDEFYPEVDFDALSIGGIQLQWKDEPTPSELALRARQRRDSEERQEKWERATYERLRAKFEGVSALELAE